MPTSRPARSDPAEVPVLARRGAPRRALAAVAAVLAATLLLGAPAGAGIGDPFDPDGTTTTTEAPTTTTEADGDEPDGSPTTAAEEPEAPSSEPSANGADGADAEGQAGGEGDDDADDDGTSTLALVAAALGGLVLGALLAGVPLALALSRRTPGPTAPAGAGAPPAAAPVARPAPAPTPVDDGAHAQRAGLVEALVSLRDQLPSDALRAEAARALSDVGVVEVSPLGEAFDPSRHRAVAQSPTDDPARHNTVAAVERPGYVDGAREVRPPEVVVARHGASS